MQTGDVEAVCKIESGLGPFPWNARKFLDCLNAGYDCRVCCLAGRVIGYALVSRVLDEASVLNFGIALEQQGRGHGRALLQNLLQDMQQAQVETVFLEVRSANRRAIRLYEGAGFIQIARRRDYYPTIDGNEDALVYRFGGTGDKAEVVGSGTGM
ncbi:MAG: ribosomal protein S18-alanine N-acetyltransferase [Pseudomonadales bacterium]|nr:ribosomal protein S18-alanine N-acetyltransferase [Pseudomonadales bacterium]